MDLLISHATTQYYDQLDQILDLSNDDNVWDNQRLRKVVSFDQRVR